MVEVSATHAQAGARQLFGTKLSPLLEHSAVKKLASLQTGPAAVPKKQSDKQTHVTGCPKCSVLWVPGITCRVRLYHSKATKFTSTSKKNKSSRARARARKNAEKRHLIFEQKLKTKLGFQFREYDRKSLKYLHYNCLNCPEIRVVPAITPTAASLSKSQEVNTQQRKQPMTSNKNDPGLFDKNESKVGPQSGRLSLSDFLL